ncbi:cell division protein FtsN [Virgibacillus phasianinus]|uniref:Cell division protein FtsN n=1 Tax=Virgibacillus phasianinus TaxID=2017483 RepID=A0A220U1D1_9BACI|nr:TasA family protein [Virgibacillus phasianinus]ASK62044.1 cell division protein FtsN [Virgibacillus phasianinus]
MGIKKKLGLGVASAALGLSLVGGGTYAYFSDEAVTNNTFAAGTLDLSTSKSTIINLESMKPGDTIYREFELQNIGNLDMSKVLLNTGYTVTDVESNNTEDLGKQIELRFLINDSKGMTVVYETTLAELKEQSLNLVEENIIDPEVDGHKGGLKAGKSNTIAVKFEFVDNGEDQNQFQGDSLNLEWAFEAKQQTGDEV